MKKVVLKHKKDAAIRRFHPWIFSGAVYKLEGQPEDGDWVEVFSSQGDWLAVGHYQAASIAIRIVSFKPIESKITFWRDKIQQAYYYRQQLNLINELTNCYRLIHAEGDGLPGLIIDIYGDCAIVQCHSIGMHKDLESIVAALQTVLGDSIQAIYNKSAETLPKEYAAQIENGYVWGAKTTQVVKENGHRFFVDWETGQKTGFFLDQRENRQLITQYVNGKSVLNAFCYSGGFSVYALQAGAKRVDSVDISERATAWTDENVALNEHQGAHLSHTADVLKFLKDANQYEVAIIDPPAFAKSLKKRHNAVQGYKRLNMLALDRLAPKGILFTFSCSQVIDRQLFEDTVTASALEVGRTVKIMHCLTQPADHPINLFHPESAYLKGLVLYVE